MSAARGSRNNTLAGLFVVVSIALTAVIVIVLSNIGERLRPHNYYTVHFSVLDGADGLEKGSAVKVGGKRVGRVTGTKFVNDPTTGTPKAIEVVMEVSSDIKLNTHSDVQLNKPLLGSGSTINIVTTPLKPPAEAPRGLTSSDIIMGRQGAPGFLSASDYGKVQDILARVDRISADVEPRIGAIMDEAQAAVANVRNITDDARGKWQDWGTKVSSLIDRAEKASADFEPIVKSVREGVDNINLRVKDTQELLAKARAFIDDNQAKLDEIVENVRELTAKAKGEGYDKVIAALDSAKVGIDEARGTVKQVDDLLMEKSPALGEIITNAALAADQLKLATVEIRAAPWRLLYQPSKKELENELLYNSVRQYSNAVTELRMASEALRAASMKPGAGKADLDAMTVKLKQAFDEYQKEERAFMNRWVESK